MGVVIYQCLLLSFTPTTESHHCVINSVLMDERNSGLNSFPGGWIFCLYSYFQIVTADHNRHIVCRKLLCMLITLLEMKKETILVVDQKNNESRRDSWRVVLWLRRLFAGFLLRWSELSPWAYDVSYVVDEVALGRVFLGVHRFRPVNYTTNAPYPFIYSPGAEEWAY